MLPAAWLAVGRARGGDALFFAHYIMTDHAGLAADVAGRFGPVLGRVRQLGIWALAFVAAMTLPATVLAAAAIARGWRSKLSAPARIVVIAALGPPALYLARGLAAAELRAARALRARAGDVAAAAGGGAWSRPRAGARSGSRRRRRPSRFRSPSGWSRPSGAIAIWAGAESMGAVTRLDGEDRALAAALRARRAPHAPVMLEPLAFADISIAHAAGVPWTESISLIVTRTPRATVAETMSATGARFIAGYDQPGGWPRTLPDWPAGALHIGRWRLVER